MVQPVTYRKSTLLNHERYIGVEHDRRKNHDAKSSKVDRMCDLGKKLFDDRCSVSQNDEKEHLQGDDDSEQPEHDGFAVADEIVERSPRRVDALVNSNILIHKGKRRAVECGFNDPVGVHFPPNPSHNR